MERNKLSAIVFIAVLLGAVALGAGAYSVYSVQTGGADGEDGDDGDDGAIGQKGDEEFYYCSSEIQVQNAIDTIGGGSGIIMLTDHITLSGTIDVDGGGSYIIQGFGLITVECPVDMIAFDITNAQSCIIRDIVIDASKITNGIPTIRLFESNDNPILIDNIRIFGGIADGIQIASDNAIVRNSYFEDLGKSIEIYSKYVTLYDNTMINSTYQGIFMDVVSSGCVIYNNYIEGGQYGIQLEPSHYNIISYNIIKKFDYQGIRCGDGSNFNEINGNQISFSLTTSLSNNRTCIGLYNGADYNEVIGNFCYNCTNSNPTQYGIGIWITSDGDNNLIAGNTCIYNDINIVDYGTDNYLYENNAP